MMVLQPALDTFTPSRSGYSQVPDPRPQIDGTSAQYLVGLFFKLLNLFRFEWVPYVCLFVLTFKRLDKALPSHQSLA